MKAKHILLTTDLSEESRRAFEPVSRLARDLDARITLLHVVPDHVTVAPLGAGIPGMAVSATEMAREANHRLDEVAEEFDSGLEVSAETIVAHDVAKAIADYAKTHSVDFLALATHGHSGIKRLLLGSTAESVARHATVPVILYPER